MQWQRKVEIADGPVFQLTFTLHQPHCRSMPCALYLPVLLHVQLLHACGVAHNFAKTFLKTFSTEALLALRSLFFASHVLSQ